ACPPLAARRGAPPADSTLRTALPDVCSTCHTGEPHTGSTAHLYRLRAADVRASLPETLALPADGSIQCWTCHDVHAGVSAVKVGHSRLSQGIRELGRKDTWSGVPDIA